MQRLLLVASLSVLATEISSAETARGVFRRVAVSSAGSLQSVAIGDFELWFTEPDADRIGRYRLSDGTFEEFAVPTADSGLSAIAYAFGSGVWFTEFRSNRIGWIDFDGIVHEFLVPTPASGPSGITATVDGRIWFTESLASKVATVDMNGVFTEFATPTGGSGPYGITGSPDFYGACFTESQANRVACISTSPGVTIHEFAVPTADSQPRGITIAEDGALWFTESASDKIGRLLQNEIVEYALPQPESGAGPWAISAPSTGDPVWFTERRRSRIGFIASDGRITEYSVQGAEDLLSIAAEGGKAWFGPDVPDAILNVRPDAAVLAGVGRIDPWQTNIDLANPTDRTSLFYTGLGFSPPSVCPGECFNWVEVQMSASESASLGPESGPFAGGPFTYYAREIGGGAVPAVSAHLLNTAVPTEMADVPVVSLSAIEASDPTVLAFPSAATGPIVRSNLMISNLGDGAPITSVVEAFGADGSLLGSKTFSVGYFDWLVVPDVLSALGSGPTENAQIRVTRTDSSALMWGALAVVRDGEETLSVTAGSNLAATDDVVLVGGAGVAGTWDTVIDLANPLARLTVGDVLGQGPLPATLCPPECPSHKISIPPNGTQRLLASEVLAPWDGHLLAATGPAVVHARVVNRANPVQAADLPTIPLSRLQAANPDVLVFPSARRGADVRTNLFLAGIGDGDSVRARVEVVSADGNVLATSETDLRSWNEPGSTFFVDLLAQLGVDALSLGQIRVTRVGGTQLLWGVLSNVYADGRLSVVAPAFP